ncbi:MAG TPA: phosphopantetheine-binding protein [Thermoanaerobaculia bacterium]
MLERITSLLASMNVDVAAGDTDLIESGVMDSLLLVEVLSRLESDLGLFVPVDDLDPEDFRSVQSIARFVSALQMSARSAIGG